MKKTRIRKKVIGKYKTRSQAINAFCKYCIHDPKAEGTWRRQISECTAQDCPLYAFRPLDMAAKKAISEARRG